MDWIIWIIVIVLVIAVVWWLLNRKSGTPAGTDTAEPAGAQQTTSGIRPGASTPGDNRSTGGATALSAANAPLQEPGAPVQEPAASAQGDVRSPADTWPAVSPEGHDVDDWDEDSSNTREEQRLAA